MSLLDIANETLQNYDPKDNPNEMDNENLPAGEYDVYIDSAGYQVYESGYECIMVKAKVLTGPCAERFEFININVEPNDEVNKKYPFLLKKNIKLIAQFNDVIGFKPTDEDWDNQKSLGDAIEKHAAGKQLILQIETGQTKKGKTYRNYQFLNYDDDSSAAISEDDLPF